MILTVPGNLLLLGEYAVLEPGGLGVALALERRARVRAEPAPELEIRGTWGPDTLRWDERHGEASPLFSEVVRVCRAYLNARGRGDAGSRRGTGGGRAAASARAGCTGRIEVDTRAFFLSPERKSGFGSSAAVSVGLTWALLLLGGLAASELAAAGPGLALRAHRAVQGGGSGYDVLTSAHGGCGLFTGGETPKWEARDLPWLPPLYLLRGPRSVSSAQAVQSYRRWKAASVSEARRFVEESNAAVREFLAAASWSGAERAFRHCGELGIRLGERIGVEARLEVPGELRGAACKALGAGNELGVAVLPTRRAGGGEMLPGRRAAVSASRGEDLPASAEASRFGGSPGLADLEPLVPAWRGVLCEP